MHPILLKNLVVVDSQSPFDGQSTDLLIQGGKIADIGPAGSVSAGEEAMAHDFAGAMVSPGWVDSMAVPSDPGLEHIESLKALAKAAVAGGVTRVICYPNTDPVVDNSQMVHSLKARSEGLPVELGFLGAVSQGSKGKELAEVYDMHLAGALGFTDGLHALQSAGMQLRVLQYLQAFQGLWVTYPEEQSLSQGGVMNEGIASTQLGMKGIPQVAESTMAARLSHLLSYGEGRLHVQPLSSPMAVELLAAAKAHHPGLSLGVSIFHLALNDEALESFDSHYKLHPPLRSPQQQEALRSALHQGAFDILCSGHHAQGVEEKQVEFSQAQPGVLGLQTLFALAYEELVRTELISLHQLVELLSVRPRQIFGLPEIRLDKGSLAELSIFHLDQPWTFTEDLCFSRARNSPYLGHAFHARPLACVCKGSLQAMR